jgi:hypothetical protein
MAFSPLPSSLEEALKEIKMWRENHKQQRTWVGLTKGEVYDLYDSDYAVFCQRIEAKLKDKNGYAEEKNT